MLGSIIYREGPNTLNCVVETGEGNLPHDSDYIGGESWGWGPRIRGSQKTRLSQRCENSRLAVARHPEFQFANALVIKRTDHSSPRPRL